MVAIATSEEFETEIGVLALERHRRWSFERQNQNQLRCPGSILKFIQV